MLVYVASSVSVSRSALASFVGTVALAAGMAYSPVLAFSGVPNGVGDEIRYINKFALIFSHAFVVFYPSQKNSIGVWRELEAAVWMGTPSAVYDPRGLVAGRTSVGDVPRFKEIKDLVEWLSVVQENRRNNKKS